MSRYDTFLTKLSAIVITCFVLSPPSAALDEDSPDCVKSLDCQLSHPIRPEEYDVSLKLFIPSNFTKISKEQEFTFEGEVSVYFYVTRNTSSLTFHASKLQFTSVKISCGGVPSFSDAIFTYDSKIVTVQLAEEVAAHSRCSIKFSYTASMNGSDDRGLVKQLINKRSKLWMVHTEYKFGTAMPRTLFPCIDENSYKAKFSLTLTYPTLMVAIASTPLKQLLHKSNLWTQSIFEKTDKIPTFGISFAVGYFKEISSEVTPKRKISVWVPTRTIATFSNSNATLAYIDKLEKYLGVDYPSHDLHIVGLPDYYDSDFICSSRRTPTMGIVFVSHSSLNSLETVGMAITRGWFGVLTTPKRWDDGFITEGFATYFSFLGEQLSKHGEVGDMRELFLGESLLFDLQLSSSSLMRHRIIEAEPSCLTREMGLQSALILQMVQRLVGEKIFRHSIQKFLREHLNDVVTHDQLYDLFTESMRMAGVKDWCGNPLNAATLLSSWLTQLGYPDVLLLSAADGGSVVLSQTTLLEEDRNSTWPIPIFLENKSVKWIPPGNSKCAVNRRLTLRGKERKMLRPSSLPYAVFVYDDYERNRIIKMFSPDSVEKLSEADKLAFLIHHLRCESNFCASPQLVRRVDTVKVVTKAIEFSNSNLMLFMAKRTFSVLRTLFIESAISNFWQHFGNSLFGRKWGNSSLEANSSRTSYVETLLGYAIDFDVSGVRLQSFELFKSAYEQCNSNMTERCELFPLSFDISSNILCGAVKYNPSYVFPRLLAIAKNLRQKLPDSLDKQESLYYGLSCVENEAMLTEYIREITEILGDTYKLSQLSYAPLLFLESNRLGGDVMASYLDTNMLDIVKKSLLRFYGPSMVQNWNSPERSDQLSMIVRQLKSLEVDELMREELEWDIFLMERTVKRNEEERKLHLDSLGSYMFWWLHSSE
ncbi:hypothetical protein AB6A40_000826 [Gnathostoma spinigerum]|uniref:Aminopeptidase n=1 Tax=Gnathostoma spinigerum TaxID=75299 RepID=A0ABD6EBQ9_9BILA